MITGHHRRGMLLIIVAAILALMIMVSMAFFVRIRQEERASSELMHEIQARSMLMAAMSYIQEAGRIGYAGNEQVGTPHQYHYSGALQQTFWNDLAKSWSATPVGVVPFQEQTWVGWYTPPHRGLMIPWWGYYQDNAWNTDATNKYYPDLRFVLWPGADFSALSAANPMGTGWQPRFQSLPFREVGGVPFWRLPLAQQPSPRAELTDQWPLPPTGKPKLFTMFMMKEPPYAVSQRFVKVGQYAVKCDTTIPTSSGKNFPRFGYGETFVPPAAACFRSSSRTVWDACNQPWAWPRSGAPPPSPDFPTYDDPDPASKGYYPDPEPLHPPTAWNGVGPMPPWRAGDPTPVAKSVNRGWFRIYRETHDTFVVTCGSGSSQGWTTIGEDVVAEAACPFDNQADLDAAIAAERRLWFRITWGPSTGVNRQHFLTSTCNQVGSIRMMQRLAEADVLALPRW